MGIRHKLYAFRYVAVSCCRRPLMTNRDDSRSLTVKIGSRGCNNLPFGSGADRDEVSQKDYVKINANNTGLAGLPLDGYPTKLHKDSPQYPALQAGAGPICRVGSCFAPSRQGNE